jgi:hypothetical protein
MMSKSEDPRLKVSGYSLSVGAPPTKNPPLPTLLFSLLFRKTKNRPANDKESIISNMTVFGTFTLLIAYNKTRNDNEFLQGERSLCFFLFAKKPFGKTLLVTTIWPRPVVSLNATTTSLVNKQEKHYFDYIYNGNSEISSNNTEIDSWMEK